MDTHRLTRTTSPSRRTASLHQSALWPSDVDQGDDCSVGRLSIKGGTAGVLKEVGLSRGARSAAGTHLVAASGHVFFPPNASPTRTA